MAITVADGGFSILFIIHAITNPLCHKPLFPHNYICHVSSTEYSAFEIVKFFFETKNMSHQGSLKLV